MVSFEDEQATVALGTGFVVDKERGLILTNRHITGVGPVRALAIFDRHEELEVDEDATWPTLTEQLNLKEAVKDGCRRYSW